MLRAAAVATALACAVVVQAQSRGHARVDLQRWRELIDLRSWSPVGEPNPSSIVLCRAAEVGDGLARAHPGPGGAVAARCERLCVHRDQGRAARGYNLIDVMARWPAPLRALLGMGGVEAGLVGGGSRVIADRPARAGLLAVQQGRIDSSVSPLGLTDLDHDTVERPPGEVDDQHVGALASAPELAAFPDAPTPCAVTPRPPEAGTGKAGARGEGIGPCHHPGPEDPREGHEEPPRARGDEVDSGELHTQPHRLDVKAYRHGTSQAVRGQPGRLPYGPTLGLAGERVVDVSPSITRRLRS